MVLIARTAMINAITHSWAVVDFVLIDLGALKESLGQGHLDGLLNFLLKRSRSRLRVVALGQQFTNGRVAVGWIQANFEVNVAHQALLFVTDWGSEFGSQAKDKLVRHHGLFL